MADTYLDYTIDVSQIVKCCRRNYQYRVNEMEMEKVMNQNIVNGKYSIYQSINGLQLVCGILFIIIAIVSIIYWKCKNKNSKHISLASEENNHYSTFIQL